MTEYRIFTCDSRSRIIAASQIIRDADRAARAFAYEILMQDETAEIWEGARYVGGITASSSIDCAKQPVEKRVVRKE